MRRILLFAGVGAASAAVQLTDIYGGELHMRHFQSRMVKDARETGVIVLRFNKIPYEDLPHPHRKLSKKWADRAFALHQWSMHQGKPEQRINRVKELGYLFVEELPPAACDRLPH